MLTRRLSAEACTRYGLGPRHIVKGFLGGLMIGTIGVLFPETLFWAEFETQTIISHGSIPLPHVRPAVGALGEYSLSDPLVLVTIGIMKLAAISFTVVAGYRGGFISTYVGLIRWSVLFYFGMNLIYFLFWCEPGRAPCEDAIYH